MSAFGATHSKAVNAINDYDDDDAYFNGLSQSCLAPTALNFTDDTGWLQLESVDTEMAEVVVWKR